MDKLEHLLVCLNEEGTEIAQSTDKALRFGLDDRYPKTKDTTCRQDIEREINDLLGVIELLQEEGVPFPRLFNREDIEAKKAKVLKYMSYARARGTLT